ncbi:MAG: hypothetical protein LM576_08955 [Thermofilum sp.]|nr:hypothetical protein [Thermofilum sp.]
MDPVGAILIAFGLEVLSRATAGAWLALGGVSAEIGAERAARRLLKAGKRNLLKMRAGSVVALITAAVAAEELLFFGLPLLLGGVPLLACGALVWGLLHVWYYALRGRSGRHPRAQLVCLTVHYAAKAAEYALLWAIPPLWAISIALHAAFDSAGALLLRRKRRGKRNVELEWRWSGGVGKEGFKAGAGGGSGR